MQIDQKMLNRLLSLPDDRLQAVIGQIAAESGIDPAQLGLDPQSIQSIRSVLGNADQTTLEELSTVYDAYRTNRGKSL